MILLIENKNKFKLKYDKIETYGRSDCIYYNTYYIIILL